jgi:hypothetical protein
MIANPKVGASNIRFKRRLRATETIIPVLGIPPWLLTRNFQTLSSSERISIRITAGLAAVRPIPLRADRTRGVLDRH